MTTPVTGVATTTPTTTTPTTTPTASKSLLDPQAFLQLLVAQLKYQDPTSPTDTSTFMNQTAMLSQVQTMDSMSSTLTQLVTAQQTQSATAMIGKHIGYTDADGKAASGLVTGVTLSGSTATLTVGGTSVPLASVTTVGLPTDTAATTTTT